MVSESLRIFPKDVLYFKGPYTRPSYEYLYLLNYTNRPIAFKLKTTAPFRFNVKPVVGIVPPGGGDVTVALLLHPLIGPDGAETEGGPFDRSKQKFMVEWTYVLEDYEQSNLVSILQKAREEGEIMECRLSCNFDAESLTSLPGTRRAIKKKPSSIETVNQSRSSGLRVRRLSRTTSGDSANVLPGKEESSTSLCLDNAASEDSDNEHPIADFFNRPLVIILIVILLMVLIYLSFHLAA